MNKKWALLVLATTTVLMTASCAFFADPTPYDPSAEGWTLAASNDFSSSVTNDEIPSLLTEGNPSVSIAGDALQYIGDSAPDDKIWLRTDYGYTDAGTAYKLYVELLDPFPVDEVFEVSFHLWHDSLDGKIVAVLEQDSMKVFVYGNDPVDDSFEWTGYSGSFDFGSAAFELLISGTSLTARLINLTDSHEYAVVSSTVPSSSYHDGHDIRFRIAGVGS